MFGGGFPCSLPLCSRPPLYPPPLCSPSVMCPYDVPVPQPFPCPVPVPQPCVQNFFQPVDVPIQNTIQPIIIPTPCAVPVPQPVPVPVERPCAVPVPHPVPVPVERPCAVPVPVPVPFPQPCAVPQPIIVREPVCVPVPVPTPMPVPMPVPTAPQCYYNPPQPYYVPRYYAEEEEYIEPIYVKHGRHHHRRHHHHHHHHHRPCTPPAALPPIVLPIAMPGPTVVSEPQPLQVTEYVQDIYPPAQIFTEQVPVGYVASNSVIQQPGQIQNQQSLSCQPGMILPPSPFLQPQQQLVQQLSCGQIVERPFGVGGCGSGGIQTLVSTQQPFLSSSNSIGLMSTCLSGT